MRFTAPNINLMHLVPRRGTLPQPAPIRADGPRPVLLLHGSFGSAGNLSPLATLLTAMGVPAIGVDYADRGVGCLHDGLDEIVAVAHQCLEVAPQIDVVGHSLGGFMGLQLARVPQMRGRIHTLVGLGAAFQGMPRTHGRVTSAALRLLFGEGLIQLTEHEFDPTSVPDDVRIVSFFSDRDRVVPTWSSLLGELHPVHGISHSALAQLNLPVAQALGHGAARGAVPSANNGAVPSAAPGVVPTNR